MKKIIPIILAIVFCMVGMTFVAEARDPIISPTPTVIPDGPTGPSRTHPGVTVTQTGSTVTFPTVITTATPGETQTLGNASADAATAGDKTSGNITGTDKDGNLTDKDGNKVTANPDDSPTSPPTGGGVNSKILGASVILLAGMAVAACVDQKRKPNEQAV